MDAMSRGRSCTRAAGDLLRRSKTGSVAVLLQRQICSATMSTSSTSTSRCSSRTTTHAPPTPSSSSTAAARVSTTLPHRVHRRTMSRTDHDRQQVRKISFANGDPFSAFGGQFGGFGGGRGGGPGGFGGNGNGNGRSPPATKKLYELLGVSENSTEKEIKAAYKKKALQFHPDRGGSEEQFKEISKAYDVLSSPEKKKLYDVYGDAGLEQMEQGGAGGGPGMGMAQDPFDMFRDIFGQAAGGQMRTRRTQDIVQKVRLSLEDIYKGVTKDYQLQRHVLCEFCGGHGGSEVVACNQCGGVGRIEQQQRMGPFVQFVQTECPKCRGAGMIVPPGKQCRPCRGKGIVEKKEFFQIHVPPTATTGYVQKFQGKADEALGFETGDLVFVVEEQRHATFHRVGQDLMIKKSLPLQDALCGFRFKIRFLDDEDVILESQPNQVVKPNDIWRIPGKGMPTSNGTFGDLIVRFEILFPNTVTPNSRDAFSKLGLDRSFFYAENGSAPASANETTTTSPAGESNGTTGSAGGPSTHRAEPLDRHAKDQLLERLQRQKDRSQSGQAGEQQCQMM
ncbi:unnamed protein product [Amoebophrya sp. A120]|nr:unnamed protein product [Amoebophrya sp. A120]|eukprot:GSA120T00001846001.1